MGTDNFCLYLQNRLILTSQTGGQWYSDTSPFSIPWRERPRKRDYEREREYLFFKGMAGALAPFSYLVIL